MATALPVVAAATADAPSEAASQLASQLWEATEDDPDSRIARLRLLSHVLPPGDVRARSIDREVAALKNGPLDPAECTALESIYLRRFELSTQPAHRIDAAIAAFAVCQSDVAGAWLISEVERLGEAAMEDGREQDAITYLQVLAGATVLGLTISDDISEEARERIGQLLWPTYLRNRIARFERTLEPAWIQEGVYDAASDRVNAYVELPMPTGLSDLRAAMSIRLQELTREVGELPGDSALRSFRAPQYRWVTDLSGDVATADATIPLETLFRAHFDRLSHRMER
jgi:hypothetical protein